MALSIDWLTQVISVPKADLIDLGGGVFELDTNAFRLELKALMASDEGIPFLDTHRHNTTVVLAGVVFARTVEIINGYTVTLEAGQYAVKLTGSNNNLADVVNVNQVSIRSNNSAGLVEVPILGLDAAQFEYLIGMVADIHAVEARSAVSSSPTSTTRRFTLAGGRQVDIDRTTGVRTASGMDVE